MEGLSPPLHLCMEIRIGIENGDSMQTTIDRYLMNNPTVFGQFVQKWYFMYKQGRSTSDFLNSLESQYRQTLLEVVEGGLNGQPILKLITELETEIMQATKDELDADLKLLPLKLLLPLLLFQFPAFLLLLFGPLLSTILKEFTL